MKHFYKIQALTESKATVFHIVKALNETEARTMVPAGQEIISVEDKGLV